MVINSLENLPEQIQLRKYDTLALNIVKYRKFTTSYIKKIVGGLFNENTLNSYITGGIRYVETGRTTSNLPPTLLKRIDKYVNEHVQPLTPSEENKRKPFLPTKKESINKIEEKPIINECQKLTSNYEYGIMVGDIIKIIKDEKTIDYFIDGLKFAGIQNYKKITVEIGECNE